MDVPHSYYQSSNMKRTLGPGWHKQPSLRGRRRRGGRGKNAWGKVMPARMLLLSSFRPLIKYAKPTQLWNVWLPKLSNQNHAAFFAVKSVNGDRFSYFSFLFFA